MKLSKRLDKIPPYLFAELDKMKAEKKSAGVDVISLGIGDPDLPTAPIVVEAMKRAVENPGHHTYPPYEGTAQFRIAMADYYERRFGVVVKPESEVIALIGSKEGIAHICLAMLDPGDVLLAPDPGYPVYKTGAIFSGAESYVMPLLKENGFLPDFGKIPKEVAKRATMMFLNYPNNPTSTSGSLDFFKEAVEFAKKNDIIIASDNSYADIYFEKAAPSILEVPGAKDMAVEFYSLSKTFNMTGWRIGALLGNSRVVGALSRIKQNLDSGTFTAIQEAGAKALYEGGEFNAKMRQIYKQRRDRMVDGLRKIGIEIKPPESTFYLWAPTPGGMNSMAFAKDLLDKTGILVTPGTGFGEYGEGYFRISLTVPDDRIDEVLGRMKKMEVLC